MLLILILVSTIYAQCFRKRFWQEFLLTHDKAIMVDLQTEKQKVETPPDTPPIKAKERPFIDDFLMSFSLVENYNKFASTDMSERTISVIHGIR